MNSLAVRKFFTGEIISTVIRPARARGKQAKRGRPRVYFALATSAFAPHRRQWRVGRRSMQGVLDTLYALNRAWRDRRFADLGEFFAADVGQQRWMAVLRLMLF